MLSVFNTAQDVYTHTHMQVCAGRLECKGLHVCVHFGDAARSSKTSVECRGKYKSGTVRALGRRKKGEGQGGGGGENQIAAALLEGAEGRWRCFGQGQSSTAVSGCPKASSSSSTDKLGLALPGVSQALHCFLLK